MGFILFLVTLCRLQKMRKAILDRRFDQFAELTMKDSNQLHACCMDTYPPLSYLNDTSRSIIELVHHINEQRMNPIVSAPFALHSWLGVDQGSVAGGVHVRRGTERVPVRAEGEPEHGVRLPALLLQQPCDRRLLPRPRLRAGRWQR